MEPQHGLTAILPCNDLNVSEAFYRQLGFVRADGSGDPDTTYRILTDGRGGHLHLVDAVEGWLVPGRNPFGLYLYTQEVDELATRLADRILEAKKQPEEKPWGMYEFSLSDPDETLVRVGWPTRLRKNEAESR
jgi:predicted lactoylglutathione lyase